MRKHITYVFAGIVLTTLTITGCSTQTATKNSVETQRNTTTNSTSTNTTNTTNTTALPATTDAAPMEIDAMPGGMLSRQWPLNVGTGMFEADYTSSGPTIGGVHWTWPSSDTNPKDYVIVPTTVQGKPYLVWCHLAPQKKLGKPENGSAGYGPNQVEPTGPSQMWMTPWSTKGGSLSNGATLITDDIPPVFSTTGQYVFPANPKDTTAQSLASSAWAGWFQWGQVTHPYTLPAPQSPVEPTVAWPNGLNPAYNGVILGVQTQVLQANQGGAINLYYIDLASHKIVGLASLTNGGGRFSSARTVSGMVFTGSATDLTSNGQTKAAAFVYNEVTGQRTRVESSAVMSQNNGFGDWVIHGSKIYDANDKLQADLNLPPSVTLEPSAATFGVATH